MSNATPRFTATMLTTLLAQPKEVRRFIADILNEGDEPLALPRSRPGVTKTAAASNGRRKPSPASKPKGKGKAPSKGKKAATGAKKAAPGGRSPLPKANKTKRGRAPRTPADITEFGDVEGKYANMGATSAARLFIETYGHDHDASLVRDVLEAGGLPKKPNNITLAKAALRKASQAAK